MGKETDRCSLFLMKPTFLRDDRSLKNQFISQINLILPEQNASRGA